MFNLLRMDLYRLLRSKSVYICLAFLLAASVLCYWMVWMIDTPEGQTAAASIGMTALGELEEAGSLLDDYDTLLMFRDIGMDGGSYVFIFGIVVVLFFCADYNSGFMKNIMSLHRRRWEYIVSKLIAVGLLDFCYLIIQFGFCMLLNVLFHNLVPVAAAKDCLFYLSLSWVVTMGFASLFLLACTFTRSNSACILVSLTTGTGLLVTFASYITGLFGFTKWASYTLYFNQTYAPSAYSGIGDLKGYAVGAVFLVLYAAWAAAVLTKKDI